MTIFLTLGPVTFANLEIPESVNFGGSQMLSVKKLIGGVRIIDALGADDDDISWSASFEGSTATFRAKFLDGMRRNGAPLPLTWGTFNYTVVIRDFKADFSRFYHIPYSITLTVIQDQNQPFPILVPVGYNDAIQNQLIEAQDIAGAIANPTLSNSLALVATAINAIPNLSIATDTQVASVITPIIATQAVVTGLITSLSARLFS